MSQAGMIGVTPAEKSGRKERPSWHDVAWRFRNERDCLASFLALEAAEVLERVKPANLVSIANRIRPCGRNPYALWKRHGASLARESGLEIRELADGGDRLLLLVYRSDELHSLLAHPAAAVILRKSGYREPDNVQAVLDELQHRIGSERFPHEIGVFLGYPLKDVVGFMKLAPLPFSCQGPWRIFGNPRESLRLAEIHRQCRCRMANRLSTCGDPCTWLSSAWRNRRFESADSPDRQAA